MTARYGIHDVINWYCLEFFTWSVPTYLPLFIRYSLLLFSFIYPYQVFWYKLSGSLKKQPNNLLSTQIQIVFTGWWWVSNQNYGSSANITLFQRPSVIYMSGIDNNLIAPCMIKVNMYKGQWIILKGTRRILVIMDHSRVSIKLQ